MLSKMLLVFPQIASCAMGKIHKQEKGQKNKKIGAKDKKTVKNKLL
jgi:hypothetical protein